MISFFRKSNRFPALAQHTGLRYFTFVALYLSQGIPEGITIFAIPAWMANNGKTAGEIATYGAVIIIPFSLKILLAPIMEKYTYLPMGRRRPWLLLGQMGIFCGLIGLSLVPDPLHNPGLLIPVVLCVHVGIIFQDIATDSLVIDIVPITQQGRANSFMWGAKVVGTSLSLALCSWLINRYGFANAVRWMSGSIVLIMFIPALLRERAGEKLLPWTAGNTSAEAAMLVPDSFGRLFKSFWQILVLRNIWILLAATFITMAAVHYMRTLLPIFTIQRLGWNNVSYSNLYSTTNLVGGLLGMIIGSLIIYRLGVVRMLQGVLLCAGILVAGMAFAGLLWKNNLVVGIFIGCINLLIVLMNIAVLALAMQMCWKRISALQFTFCMTVFNGALAAGAALLGDLRNYIGWQAILLIFSALVVAAMLMLKFIRLNNYLKKVENLELNHVTTLSKQ